MNILKFLKPKACVDFVYDDNTARQALEKMKKFTALPLCLLSTVRADM